MDLPKGVRRVCKRLADGSQAVYFYYRPTGAKLPPPDDPGFADALDAARQPSLHDWPSGTFGALVAAYRRSPKYRNLAPNTAKYYDRALAKLQGWGPLKVAEIKRSEILDTRDSHAIKSPQAANQLVMVLACIFDFAVDREWREYNPCHRIKRLEGGERLAWPNEAISYALKAFDEHYRRAVLLALYSGQREGDCVKMTWEQYDGTGIAVRQQKTGAVLWIPAHKLLRRELNGWRDASSAQTILTHSFGRPWKDGRSFSTMFTRMMKGHPPLRGLVFHGLRKSAAARLAEAGCSEREIMAITGHASSQMVDHYTKQANQRVRALTAIKKLEDYR